ncbi:EAL domain-containing protein [Rhizobium sp. CG4]|jgi:PAS domain S-box-containing protein|uniref:EAL domain-containing protein n=1 Tax=Rhizobium sp. CG4 TaxID=2726075 RepID=UPI0020334BD1|nr:EAL domain-containing protein [Rhizobium sp. CG4]MCM2458644.1 EAL domain-containing protein [Rhizobium sp. CG4]
MTSTFFPSIDDLLAAVEGSRFVPAFQPFIDLETQKTSGFEVLARWDHPAHGVINPDAFISTAESVGAINAITLQVLEKACRELTCAPRSLTLALNLSPVQFRNDEIVSLIGGVVSNAGLLPSQIEIELTENALLDDIETAHQVAKRFRDEGFLLSLDDFGTGFSSLTRLHSLPFNTLKIDKQFVGSMDQNPASRRIVSSVIDLGQSLGMRVVAEGIETPHQLALLQRMGCNVGQGYHLGRPTLGKLPRELRYPFGGRAKGSSGASRYQRKFHSEAIYENSPCALALLDGDGRILRMNEQFAHVMSLVEKQSIGSHFAQHFDRKNAFRITQILAHMARGREIRQQEVKDRRSSKTFVVNCTRVNDDDGGFIGFSLALTDISRLRQVEAVLKADEGYARLLATEERLHIIWAANSAGTIDYLGPTLSATESVGMEDRIKDWYGRMHPDDHIRVRKKWLEWLPSKLPFETNFRVRDVSGHWRQVRSAAKPSFDSAGQVESWIGLITDCADQSPQIQKGDESPHSPLLAKLTAQQLDLLTWAAAGKSNADIATITGLSRRGVEYHMEQILKKLGVASKVQAAALLGRHGPQESPKE